jgi:hypothetical protein
VPLLVTSSLLEIGGHELYSLLFEQIPANTAIVTTDGLGVIQSATHNIRTVLGVSARELVGRLLDQFVKVACLACCTPQALTQHGVYSTAQHSLKTATQHSTTPHNEIDCIRRRRQAGWATCGRAWWRPAPSPAPAPGRSTFSECRLCSPARWGGGWVGGGGGGGLMVVVVANIDRVCGHCSWPHSPKKGVNVCLFCG